MDIPKILQLKQQGDYLDYEQEYLESLNDEKEAFMIDDTDYDALIKEDKMLDALIGNE